MNKVTAISEPDYAAFLTELKNRIVRARSHAARVINREVVRLYWDIGREIVARQAEQRWGQSVIDRLASDLQQAFPGTSGFSARNLRDVKRFYSEYSNAEFWRQTAAIFGQPGSWAGLHQFGGKLPPN